MSVFSRSRKTAATMLSPVQQRQLSKPIAKAWLIHWPGTAPGITHWIVVAKTIEQAWEQAHELPGDPALSPQLGCVIEGPAWPDFTRQPLKTCCDICTPKGELLQQPEQRMWEMWINGHPAETHVPWRQVKEGVK